MDSFGDIELLCVCPPNTDVYRICIPANSLSEIIEWYHEALGHVGERRLQDTIATHLCHPNLRAEVIKILRKCNDCDQCKLLGKGYGHLPPRNTKLQPWEEVACDTIGPWKIKVNGQVAEFKALTAIDIVSSVCELVRVDNGTSVEAANKFESSWLHRYPRPTTCIHDNGPEFQFGFIQKLEQWGIKNVPTTSRNPQANSVCERMHQTVGNIIRTYIHTHPPET